MHFLDVLRGPMDLIDAAGSCLCMDEFDAAGRLVSQIEFDMPLPQSSCSLDGERPEHLSVGHLSASSMPA